MAYRRKRKPRKKKEPETKPAKEPETKPAEASKTYNLILVPPHDIPECWPLGVKWIEVGSDIGEFSPNELASMCLSGEAQLWFVWSDQCEAAGVTTMKITPGGQVLMILAFGGSGMKAWWSTQDQLYAWAKEQGCDIVRLYGRKGWARALKDKGFKMTRVILDKELH